MRLDSDDTVRNPLQMRFGQFTVSALCDWLIRDVFGEKDGSFAAAE
jgi:hypothetical protein